MSGGFSYSFKVYPSATKVQLSDGSSAYSYDETEVLGVKPIAPINFLSCAAIGDGWRQVFNVKVYGAQRPVCSPAPTAYLLYFTALGSSHLFTITYKTTQSSAAYPTLQAIFGSVQVTK